jgi:uncharacterized DUF497 family protein
MEYPDGDHVVAWVTVDDGEVLVTDYGKGFERLLSHPPQVRATLKQFGRTFAEGQGADFYDDRVSARVERPDVGEAIWRVAAASAQLAQAAVVFQPKRRGARDYEFEREITRTFDMRRIEFESRVPIVGASGRTHHATFYLPSRRAAIEPVSARGVWSQVASVYGKFGDLAHSNGDAPSRFSLVDDRSAELSRSDADFLGQVSEVVPWSNRERLVDQVM